MPTNAKFRPDLNELLEKHKITFNGTVDEQKFLEFLTSINTLLEYNDLKSTTEHNTLKEKFKKYVVSTLKFSSLSKMISGIAHEINTPLAIVQIRTDQLIEATEAQDFNKESFEKSLTSIDQTAKRIGAIVTRLRTYAKSLVKEEISITSVKKLIEDTAALTRDRFLAEGITLEIVPSEIDPKIECCSSDISQALLNILNNSFAALKGSTEKWIRVAYLIKENQVHIEITDAGPGIQTQIRSSLFNPYFTSGAGDSALGLGLTIARDYAVAHHGNLVLDETSENTKFIITLPIASDVN